MYVGWSESPGLDVVKPYRMGGAVCREDCLIGSIDVVGFSVVLFRIRSTSIGTGVGGEADWWSVFSGVVSSVVESFKDEVCDVSVDNAGSTASYTVGYVND